ncbi:CocE/NonD family hydrolase [Mycolicibacterium smegmatis]|uniref:CocE/NonD family hydrolase n=1 Tax=Mycolicibacterium smegmatis TaxID=1772 RepID=UPI001E5B65BB|nr:CocE/NonD family hydrolase [Mycolicibacterium smegmatis]UGU30660.1 CocE/NonD family hydrolase [Mycolicibacterium smegmatis]ULN71575.1 CocE/NonD family hydrolase [Mycolicibacterium smegmatis]
MIIERDVAVPCDDGLILRADVFRPDDGEPAPVVMTLGPYGKGVEYSDGYAPQWNWLMTTYPDILPGSSRSYMAWETVDPEIWVPWGYAVVRVDSRGAGRSPGVLDMLSPREVRDHHDAIEWAARQPWSTGKVGLNGISYYAINQWLVAAQQPPSLAAMIPWEGAGDFYRDWARHGGIVSNGFLEAWYPRQVVSVQHGNPDGRMDRWQGERATGPEDLSEEELALNRNDPLPEILKRPLDDEFYRDRSPDWSKVTVPFLSAANWAGFGLHPRGNFEAFTQAASAQKWLEAHPGRHEEWFYLPQGMALQKEFLDHFLKGEDNGWDARPPVLLHIRRPFTDKVEVRTHSAWPLENTQWTEVHLDAADMALPFDPVDTEHSVTFDAAGEPLTFLTCPLTAETELTGPLSARLFVSSSTIDADLFVTLQAFAPDGREVEFQGTIDPHTPLAQGWLRASHRKLDVARSLPYRPYHSHDELQPLDPGTIYQLDIEIWPTCIVLPAGYRIALQISGHDFEREEPKDGNEAWVSRGSGPWLHTHPEDRPASIYAGRTTIHTGGSTPSTLLLPVIPS